MLELELIPVIGVHMVRLIYGHNTNMITTDYEFTIGEKISDSE